jgi:predicted Fe-Mo cluster-binding NifX family protein
MKVAIPHWQGRVSPVFDVARRVLLVDVAGGREADRSELLLRTTDPVRRAREIARGGASVLICGAISWPLEMALSAVGIHVIAQVCGEVEEVLRAFWEGKLLDGAFLMPGGCGRRRCGLGGHGHGHARQDGYATKEPGRQNGGVGSRGPVT